MPGGQILSLAAVLLTKKIRYLCCLQSGDPATGHMCGLVSSMLLTGEVAAASRCLWATATLHVRAALGFTAA
jgi:hypothetical protein